MNTQPEPLWSRLSRELDAFATAPHHKQAAAELRRQHGEIKSMQAERMNTERRLLAVEAQRDALLEALKEMLEYSGLIEERCDTVTTNKARAAIKAAEETK